MRKGGSDGKREAERVCMRKRYREGEKDVEIATGGRKGQLGSERKEA